MAGRAVLHDPFAGPIGDTLAVGTADPVFFLPEMTLSAHLVAVIHVYFRSGFGHQKITLILFMTGITG